MNRFRPIANAAILTVYLVRKVLFIVARVWGSIPGIFLSCLATVLYIEASHDKPVLFWLPFGGGFLCRSLYPRLRVKPLQLLQAPVPPPAPPPSASAAQGRSDDPSEATVIGRLDPKLRDLLRPKSDSAAG